LVELRGFELMAIAAWRPRFERFRHGISNVMRADLKAAEGIGLVYGGGGNGLMGRLARSTLAAGGYVVALPGGIGTLEELVEMMTWAQLNRHARVRRRIPN
jgi:predicted Rossmann-fold nucleotide-binding protein